MKLTLRFLLAYMDDILRPADAREVGRELGSNKTASQIVQRVRDTIRMRRLSAPDPLDETPGRNANDVAEYLDNLLPQQDIRLFEQQCLESDEQLAEVGACHQILTLVLGGGITVPESTRNKLKQLATQIPTAGQPSDNGKVTNNSSITRVTPEDIPPLEWKRNGIGWKRTVTALGIMLLAGAWIFSIVTDPAFQSGNRPTAEPQPRIAQADPAKPDAAVALAQADQPGAAPNGQPAATGPVPAPNSTTPTAPSGSPRSETGSQQIATRIDPEPTDLPDLEFTPPSTAPMQPADQNQASTEPGEAPQPPTTAMPSGQTPPAGTPPTEPGEPTETEAAPPVILVRERPVCLEPGVQYESADQLLLINSEHHVDATVAQAGQEIPAGMQLIVPRYSQVTFSLGDRQASWQVLEKSSVQVLGADDHSCLGFRIYQGRGYLNFPNPDPDQSLTIRLVVHHRTWYVELPPETTGLAWDVMPQQPTHYETMPTQGPVVAQLWVTGAPVKLRPADLQQWQTVARQAPLLPETPPQPQPPANASTPADAAPQTPEQPSLPDWLTAAPPTLVASQRRDQRDFAKAIESSKNLWLDLQGVASDPNPRIAELAAESLALGQRDTALVAVLAHSPHEESRTAAITGLRNWMLGSSEHRQILRDALERTFSDQTARIVYHLLWGYDARDGRDPGISRQLVDGLRHEHVAVRELSIYWIAQLTGQKQSYRPLAPLATREQAVANWERHLSRQGGALVDPSRDR